MRSIAASRSRRSRSTSGAAPRRRRTRSATGYFDEGRVALAETVAREALERTPGPILHNHLLRCLLASPEDAQQTFFDESVRWARLYEDRDQIASGDTFRNRRDPHRTLRIAFMADYGHHGPGIYSLAPLFRAFDQARVPCLLLQLRAAGARGAERG